MVGRSRSTLFEWFKRSQIDRGLVNRLFDADRTNTLWVADIGQS
jgi:hypothetical protein